MIKENKILQPTVSAGEYTAPKIKVKELRTHKVLCASDKSNFNLENNGVLGNGEDL